MKSFQTSKIKHRMKSHHACPIGKPKSRCKTYFATTIFLRTVGNKAKSQELKNQINRKEVDDLKAYATKIYITEQQRSLVPGEKKKSLRQICRDASNAHFASTGRCIILHHNTLAHHGKGGVTLTESNGRMTAKEQDNIM
jgi:hypothetical protein